MQSSMDMHALATLKGLSPHWPKMQSDGVTPTVVSYSSVLHACAKSSDGESAESGLAQVQDNGEQPSAICFNAVIHAWSECSDIDRASFWIQEMPQRGVNATVSTYSTIMAQAIRHGDTAAAHKHLVAMTDLGLGRLSVAVRTWVVWLAVLRLANISYSSDSIDEWSIGWESTARPRLQINVARARAWHGYVCADSGERAPL